MTDEMSIRKSKLSALVPPPRVNLVRYHGVLAPHAKDRDKIVPSGERPDGEGGEEKPAASRKYRLTWAALLARVFHVYLERSAYCGGKMRVLAAITDPSSVRRYLEGVGLSPKISEIAPARAPPQTEFDFDL